MNYAAAFGEQWKRYRLTQLDSFTGTPITERRLRRCLGPLWDRLASASVLECGCGAGRFTEVMLREGAKVISIDLSDAVAANQLNCPQTRQHGIAQADILRLPFKPEQFDLVLCLGVIQHTPCPETSIQCLAKQVKPGGWLVIDHYTTTPLKTISSCLRTAKWARLVMKRLPPGAALAWTERLVDFFLPLHRAVRSSRLARSLLGRVSPVMTYYDSLPELPDHLQREWAFLDTHDSLTDWFKHFRSREQIIAALESTGAVDIWCEYGGNGVEARCAMPHGSRVKI